MNSSQPTPRKRADSAGAKPATEFPRRGTKEGTSKAGSEVVSAPTQTSNTGEQKPALSSQNGSVQQRIKVLQCKAPKEFAPLLTLNAPSQFSSSTATIGSMRSYLHQKVSFSYRFCLEDGSDVVDSMPIADYINSLDSPSQPPAASTQANGTDSEDHASEAASISGPVTSQGRFVHIYIRESQKTNAGALSSGQFLLKFVRKAEEDLGEGSMLGTSLPASQWPRMTLGHLRPQIKSMSAYPNSQVFCYSDETIAPDSMGLETYLKKAEAPHDIDSELPTFTVYFRKTGPRKEKEKSQIADFVRPKTAIDTSLDLKLDKREGEKLIEIDKMLERAADFSKLGIQPEDLAKLIPAKEPKYQHPGELDENQWQLVLRNCSVFHGWYVDAVSGQVKRAPRPAFRLRPGLNIPDTNEGTVPETLAENSQESPPASLPLAPPRTISRTSVSDKVTEVVTRLGKITKDAQQLAKPPAPTEPQSTPAATPATPATSASDTAPSAEFQSVVQPPKTATETTSMPEKPAVEGLAPVTVTAQETQELERPKQPDPETLPSFPSFVTNDESKVEVAALSHELSISMAQNQFSITSLEVSASGSFAGVSASASGGFTKSSSSGSGSTDTKKESTMFAKYKYPRATIYLHPEDLELTNDMKKAIDRVKLTKNIEDLRMLQRTFGHFFCHEILIGGCLQTTRATTLSGTQTWSQAKEQFKVQAGFSAGMPGIFEVSVKSSHEEGSSKEDRHEETNASDKVVFEATGGNTVLASDPPRWCVSVLEYTNWRVIERAGLSPLVDAIATCATKDYSKVATWFTQAVPALSDFVKVPTNRTLTVRLKLNGKIPGITDRQSTNKTSPVRRYLGHRNQAVRPVRMTMQMKDVNGLPTYQSNDAQKAYSVYDDVYNQLTQITAYPAANTRASQTFFGPAFAISPVAKIVQTNLTTMFQQVDNGDQMALFSPAQTQAPVVLQYEDIYQEADFQTAEKYEESLWQMVVMDGELLSHGALVGITSYHKEKKLHLSIYRNEQGHYMPAITTSGSQSYWRVFKANENLEVQPNSFIRDGDSIRLCWCFSDQRSGFRDYYDDVFGRRSYRKPEETKSDRLFLKLPFPGFQRSDSNEGAAMIMSSHPDTRPIMESLRVVPGPELADNVSYNMFDLSFRLDVIEELGTKELTDYMTLGLDQRAIRTMTEAQKEALDAYINARQEQEFKERQAYELSMRRSYGLTDVLLGTLGGGGMRAMEGSGCVIQ